MGSYTIFLMVIPPPVFLSHGISMAEGERG